MAVSSPSLLLIHLQIVFGYLLMALKWHRLNRRLCSATLEVRVEVRVAEKRLSLADNLCTRPALGGPRRPLCLWRSVPQPLMKGASICQHREMGVDQWTVHRHNLWVR